MFHCNKMAISPVNTMENNGTKGIQLDEFLTGTHATFSRQSLDQLVAGNQISTHDRDELLAMGKNAKTSAGFYDRLSCAGLLFFQLDTDNNGTLTEDEVKKNKAYNALWGAAQTYVSADVRAGYFASLETMKKDEKTARIETDQKAVKDAVDKYIENLA